MRRIVLLLFFATALGALPASAQWRRAGLDGQAIGALAVDPSNASTLYASSFGAISTATTKAYTNTGGAVASVADTNAF